METALLGKSTVSVSRLALGSGTLAGTVARADKNEAARVLERAFDAGITFYDTANIYGQGRAEELIGGTFRSRRDRVVIATKGGYKFSAAAGLLSRLKPLARRLIALKPGLLKAAHKVRSSQLNQDFSREALTAALEGSLRRLRTDYVDVYLLHSPPAEVLKDGGVFGVLGDFQSRGLIRCHGVACLESEHALLCPAETACVQVSANLLCMAALEAVLAKLAERGVSVIAREPFASAKLLRAPLELTAADFADDDARLQRAQAALAGLSGIRPLPELALKFLLQHPRFACVLFGTTRVGHLEKNLAAASSPPLTADEASRIDSAIRALS